MFNNNEKCSLSEIADINMGQSPDSSTYNDEGNGLPFFQGKTEFGDIFIGEPLKFCSSPIKIAEADDVLMSVRAPVGSVNITKEKCCIGRGLASIRYKEGISSTWFIFYALRNMEKEIEAMGVGSTFKAITKKDLFSLQVPVVPINTQMEFVYFAQQSDKSKFVCYSNFKSQFIEMFNCMDYPETVIGDEFITTSGGTPSRKRSEYYEGGTIPWMTSSEVNQGIIHQINTCITEEGFNNSSAKIIPSNSVVIAMYGATAGKVGLLKIATTTNQAVCSIFPNEEFNPYYLYYAVKMKEDWMIENAAGAAQPNISQGIIKSMVIKKPPLDIQNQFAAFVQQSDKSKFSRQFTCNLLNNMLDNLNLFRR